MLGLPDPSCWAQLCTRTAWGAFYLFAYLFRYLPFHTTLLIFLIHSFICIYFVSLGYSCCIMLHQLLLRGEGNQPHVYAYPLPFGFPSRPGHHRARSRVQGSNLGFSLRLEKLHPAPQRRLGQTRGVSHPQETWCSPCRATWAGLPLGAETPAGPVAVVRELSSRAKIGVPIQLRLLMCSSGMWVTVSSF